MAVSTEARARWMSVLAQADPAAVEAAWRRLDPAGRTGCCGPPRPGW